MNRAKFTHVLIALLLGVSGLSVSALSASADPIPIPIASASDQQNSQHADRLIDGATGTGDGAAWSNPNIWNADGYPMTAVLDLGGAYELDTIRYFVGNISQGSDLLHLEASATSAEAGFASVASMSTGHQWNSWRTVDAEGTTARWLRLRFEDRYHRFNISELEVTGEAAIVIPPTTTTTTTAPVTTTTTTNVPPGDQPRATPPPANIVRAFGFGNWPSDHLSTACITLHDSYWTQGPDAGQNSDSNHPSNRAYHTWHPAKVGACDFGHEHGFAPNSAPADVFDLFGGWPAFGYVAAQAATDGTAQRHEDHVGHKVTVARFRASIGNGSGPETLYDAGFECDWLSKIHQGSHSLDAFSNHLHEYFLALRCFDGKNAAGVVDNTVVGTEFSVKLMYTYGAPNTFVDEICSGESNPLSSSLLIGPEGQSVPSAMRTTPIGATNHRAFNCVQQWQWKDLDTEVSYVDIWNQIITIQRPDGETALQIQPYYMVKNPARVLDTHDGTGPIQIIRTIDLCYGADGQKTNFTICQSAPNTPTAWDSAASPFNGAFRSIHFKSSWLQNEAGPTQFCTDAFGRSVQDTAPCDTGNVLQRAASINNHWNDGEYSYGNRSGNVAGSIWASDPHGNTTSAQSDGNGGYTPNGIGFEFIVDNRNPDDNFDGVPDGANIRGRN